MSEGVSEGGGDKGRSIMSNATGSILQSTSSRRYALDEVHYVDEVNLTNYRAVSFTVLFVDQQSLEDEESISAPHTGTIDSHDSHMTVTCPCSVA